MSVPLAVTLLGQADSSLSEAIDDARALLGAPVNETLFPPHFLKSTFARLGGKLAKVTRGNDILGIGFLFPRSLGDERREYTLRFHRVHSAVDDAAPAEIAAAVEIAADAGVHFYDPLLPSYASDISEESGVVLARPDAAEAQSIRAMQQEIWRYESPDSLYPADLHSLEFRAGTSLVAKIDGVAAGFLFGFYKFGGAPLPPALEATHPSSFRLESQLLGVLKAHGRRDVGTLLKAKQAELAREDGIHVVNWTFDPLQYGNAKLNFHRLGAVAFHFHPRLYDFTNELSVAPASRVSVTWLVESRRVTEALQGRWRAEVDLAADATGIVRLNDGAAQIADPGDARRIAIEIPADWNALQKDASQHERMLAWRNTTDAILASCIAPNDGSFALTGTGIDGERRFLIGERIDLALLRSLDS